MSDPLRAETNRAVVSTTNNEPVSIESESQMTQPSAQPSIDEAIEDHQGDKPTAIEPAPVDEEAKALALAIAEAADDRKAGNITILQTGDVSYLADYFVIVTGFSKVQVRAISTSIEDAIEEKFDRQPLRTEGVSEGRWVLKDYGEVIAHVFMPDDREYYDLDAFWGHAERIEFIPTPMT